MNYESFLSFLFYGGYCLIPLAVIFLASVIIFICRLVALKKAVKTEDSFMKRIRDYIIEGDVENALLLCQNQPTPLKLLLNRGINALGKPMSEIQTILYNTEEAEIQSNKKGLIWLKFMTIAAPLVGITGFCIGLAQLYYEMADSTNVLIDDAFSQAFVTLASGFGIAVISLFCLISLKSLVNRLSFLLKEKSLEFIDLLNEPS